jgi:hypothetical protein
MHIPWPLLDDPLVRFKIEQEPRMTINKYG